MNTQAHNPETLRGEVYRLADALLAGELSPADDRRLRQLVLDNAEARRHYIRFMHDSALLGQWGREGVQSRESRVESLVKYPESPYSRIPESPEINLQISKSPNLQIPARHSPLTTLHYWAISYSVATVLLAIALLGAWSYTITHPDADSLAVKNSRSAAPSGSAANTTPEFTFVGRISGMVDCQWAEDASATSPGAGVALNRRYALRSGLMEITYDSGAKVILQGPCEYTVESARGGFLQIGKLTARVGEGAGGRGQGSGVRGQGSGVRGQGAGNNLPSPVGRGAGGEGLVRGAGGEGSRNHSQTTLTLSQGERGQNISSTPHSPRPAPLFTIRTPTATVEDLGTEFGVEVLQSGETASHVFQGRVVMRTAGAGDGRSGTRAEKPESPNPRIPNPELILSAGQSARVEKDDKSGELKLLSGDKAASSAQTKYVRRLREPPKFLDLLDIVAGGNGLGNRRERGVDPTSGVQDPQFVPRERGGEPHGKYRLVGWHKLIDGVFVPDGKVGSVQLDSAGHVYDAFPATDGRVFGSIWPRAAELEPYDRRMEIINYWVYAMGPGEQFMPERRGLLSLSSNVGITFDLEAMRRECPDIRPSRFRAVAGLADARRTCAEHGEDSSLLPSSVAVDLWVFVDGRLKFKQLQLRPESGTVKVDVELGPGDRFLTLAVTDGGDEITSDWFVLGDPVLDVEVASDNGR
jgi:hypothetical protein